MSEEKVRLGDLLLAQDLITEPQLEEALKYQKEKGIKLGKAITALKFLNEKTILATLSNQLNIPLIDFSQTAIDANQIVKLPEVHARRLKAIVLREDPDGYLVGIDDPLDLIKQDELKRILKKPIKLGLLHSEDLEHCLDLYTQHGAEIAGFVEELSSALKASSSAHTEEINVFKETNVPVAKLLNSLFERAIQVNASDIHIEPDEKGLRIRQRVDGKLQEQFVEDKSIAAPLLQRIKLMANLNIAEKRLPQDGSFAYKVQNEDVDVRLSTVPTQYGEAAVMRILRRQNAYTELSRLGIPEEQLKVIDYLINLPYGLILVTGPTGSGKTSSIYSMLTSINKPEEKIITIEDPVEHKISRLTQIQINPAVHLDFARVLRSVLRHDPDIILIGELRDTETARIGLRAALTGHLVFSTLHTNDSISAPVRLIDMGTENYIVASALRAVISQRLVRLICDNCSEPYQPTDEERKRLEAIHSVTNKEIQKLNKGKGCHRCNKTGYRGRTGTFELLLITPELITTLQKGDLAEYYKEAENQLKGHKLIDSAWSLAIQGKTTLEEVFRIANE